MVNTEPVFSQHSENATLSSPVTVHLPDTNPGHSHPSRRVTVEEVPDEGDAPVQGHGVIDEEEVERNVQLDQDEEPELEPQPPLPRQRRRVPVSNAVPGPYPHPIPAPALRRSARARNPVERYTSSKGQPQHARTSHSTRAAAGGGAPQAETAQAEELQDEEDDVEHVNDSIHICDNLICTFHLFIDNPDTEYDRVTVWDWKSGTRIMVSD